MGAEVRANTVAGLDLCIYCDKPKANIAIKCCIVKNQNVSLVLKKSLQCRVPVVAQQLTNPTRNHEVSGSIRGLAQWVKDLALL